MCKALLSHDCTIGLKSWKAGEIVELPYGSAIALKAVGAVGGLVNEAEAHSEAQEMLAVYGGDCWFPQHQQTISRVAEFLAQSGHQTSSVN